MAPLLLQSALPSVSCLSVIRVGFYFVDIPPWIISRTTCSGNKRNYSTLVKNVTKWKHHVRFCQPVSELLSTSYCVKNSTDYRLQLADTFRSSFVILRMYIMLLIATLHLHFATNYQLLTTYTPHEKIIKLWMQLLQSLTTRIGRTQNTK